MPGDAEGAWGRRGPVWTFPNGPSPSPSLSRRRERGPAAPPAATRPKPRGESPLPPAGGVGGGRRAGRTEAKPSNVRAGSDGIDGRALVSPAAMTGCVPLWGRVGHGDDLPPEHPCVRTARALAFDPQPRSDHVCASCTAAMMRKCIQYAINVSLLIGFRLHTGLPVRGLGPECRTLSRSRRREGAPRKGVRSSKVERRQNG